MAVPDTSVTVAQNVIVIDLAQAIQHARADYYGHPRFELKELPRAAVDRYIATAADLMRQLAPAPKGKAPEALAESLFKLGASINRVVATGLRRPDGIIGTIQPGERQ